MSVQSTLWQVRNAKANACSMAESSCCKRYEIVTFVQTLVCSSGTMGTLSCWRPSGPEPRWRNRVGTSPALSSGMLSTTFFKAHSSYSGVPKEQGQKRNCCAHFSTQGKFRVSPMKMKGFFAKLKDSQGFLS